MTWKNIKKSNKLTKLEIDKTRTYFAWTLRISANFHENTSF